MGDLVPAGRRAFIRNETNTKKCRRKADLLVVYVSLTGKLIGWQIDCLKLPYRLRHWLHLEDA